MYEVKEDNVPSDFEGNSCKIGVRLSPARESAIRHLRENLNCHSDWLNRFSQNLTWKNRMEKPLDISDVSASYSDSIQRDDTADKVSLSEPELEKEIAPQQPIEGNVSESITNDVGTDIGSSIQRHETLGEDVNSVSDNESQSNDLGGRMANSEEMSVSVTSKEIFLDTKDVVPKWMINLLTGPCKYDINNNQNAASVQDNANNVRLVYRRCPENEEPYANDNEQEFLTLALLNRNASAIFTRNSNLPKLDASESGSLVVRTRQECGPANVNTSAVLPDSETGIPTQQGVAASMYYKTCHFAKMGEYLRESNSGENFFDVKIEVLPKVFYAHRVALACHSEYFAKFFADKVEDRRKYPMEIQIQGITAEAFEIFLKYVYDGECNPPPETIPDVVIAAEKFRIPALLKACYLIGQNLSLESALIILNRIAAGGAFYDTAFNIVLNKFPSALASRNLALLDIGTIVKLLSNDQLNVPSEVLVFNAVLLWIQGAAAFQAEYVHQLTGCVRFSLMSPVELMQCCQSYIFQEYQINRQRLLQANWIITTRELKVTDPFGFEKDPPRKVFEPYKGYNDEVFRNVMEFKPLGLHEGTIPPSSRHKIDEVLAPSSVGGDLESMPGGAWGPGGPVGSGGIVEVAGGSAVTQCETRLANGQENMEETTVKYERYVEQNGSAVVFEKRMNTERTQGPPLNLTSNARMEYLPVGNKNASSSPQETIGQRIPNETNSTMEKIGEFLPERYTQPENDFPKSISSPQRDVASHVMSVQPCATRKSSKLISLGQIAPVEDTKKQSFLVNNSPYSNNTQKDLYSKSAAHSQFTSVNTDAAMPKRVTGTAVLLRETPGEKVLGGRLSKSRLPLNEDNLLGANLPSSTELSNQEYQMRSGVREPRQPRIGETGVETAFRQSEMPDNNIQQRVSPMSVSTQQHPFHHQRRIEQQLATLPEILITSPSIHTGHSRVGQDMHRITDMPIMDSPSSTLRDLSSNTSVMSTPVRSESSYSPKKTENQFRQQPRRSMTSPVEEKINAAPVYTGQFEVGPDMYHTTDIPQIDQPSSLIRGLDPKASTSATPPPPETSHYPTRLEKQLEQSVSPRCVSTGPSEKIPNIYRKTSAPSIAQDAVMLKRDRSGSPTVFSTDSDVNSMIQPENIASTRSRCLTPEKPTDGDFHLQRSPQFLKQTDQRVAQPVGNLLIYATNGQPTFATKSLKPIAPQCNAVTGSTCVYTTHQLNVSRPTPTSKIMADSEVETEENDSSEYSPCETSGQYESDASTLIDDLRVDLKTQNILAGSRSAPVPHIRCKDMNINPVTGDAWKFGSLVVPRGKKSDEYYTSSLTGDRKESHIHGVKDTYDSDVYESYYEYVTPSTNMPAGDAKSVTFQKARNLTDYESYYAYVTNVTPDSNVLASSDAYYTSDETSEYESTTPSKDLSAESKFHKMRDQMYPPPNIINKINRDLLTLRPMSLPMPYVMADEPSEKDASKEYIGDGQIYEQLKTDNDGQFGATVTDQNLISRVGIPGMMIPQIDSTFINPYAPQPMLYTHEGDQTIPKAKPVNQVPGLNELGKHRKTSSVTAPSSVQAPDITRPMYAQQRIPTPLLTTLASTGQSASDNNDTPSQDSKHRRHHSGQIKPPRSDAQSRERSVERPETPVPTQPRDTPPMHRTSDAIGNRQRTVSGSVEAKDENGVGLMPTTVNASTSCHLIHSDAPNIYTTPIPFNQQPYMFNQYLPYAAAYQQFPPGINQQQQTFQTVPGRDPRTVATSYLPVPPTPLPTMPYPNFPVYTGAYQPPFPTPAVGHETLVRFATPGLSNTLPIRAERGQASENARPIGSPQMDGQNTATTSEGGSKEVLTWQAKPVPEFGDMLVIGGHSTTRHGLSHETSIYRYSRVSEEWAPFVKLPEPRLHHSAAKLGKDLYLIGGCGITEKSLPQATTYAFNSETKTWSSKANMNDRRMYHRGCALFGMLYVVGGQDETGKVLNSIEVYNPNSDIWSRLSGMGVARLYPAVAIACGRMYVAGGYGVWKDKTKGRPVLDTMEYYDPLTNAWSTCTNLLEPRYHATMVDVQDHLYIIGGAKKVQSDDPFALESLASIDMYDPVTDTWSRVTSMCTPRHAAGSALIGTKIYIVGGICCPVNREVQSIEVYDAATGAWEKDIRDLPFACRSFDCIIIPHDV